MGPGIKWCQSVRCQWICLSTSSNLQFTGMSSLACRGLERSWKSNQDLDQDLGSFWGLWPHWQEVLMVLMEKKQAKTRVLFLTLQQCQSRGCALSEQNDVGVSQLFQPWIIQKAALSSMLHGSYRVCGRNEQLLREAAWPRPERPGARTHTSW